jgi:Cd2+/Zn2+-exporting ATPase
MVDTAIRIAQMDCPTEEALIRDKLTHMEGVVALDFNLMQRVLTVTHEPAVLEIILKEIRALGFVTELASDNIPSPIKEIQKPWWPLVLSAFFAVGAEVIEWLDWATPWAPLILALIAICLIGLTTYHKGWIAIKNGNLNINALMSIAVSGAFLLGQWPEAAMVMCLFSIAERLEAASLDRARNAIHSLMAMAPERATVKQLDGTWESVDAKTVPVGASIRARPGERIPLDGSITRGQSTVDQAPITGESMPIEKTVGDTVFAGTMNQGGELEYTVTALSDNSTLSRILHAVEAAQSSRAPTQRFVDQFARIYTPLVFVMALLVAIVPPLFLGGVWFDYVYKALVLLVIACPCALVISTPVSIVSGLAAAAHQGILIKGGVYLEQGHAIRWIALDKTGTITYGKPVQTDFEIIKSDFSITKIRALAASLASHSDHPVSKAIAYAATDNQVEFYQVENFVALAGRGIKGQIDGQMFCLGNHHLIEELGMCSPSLEAKLNAWEQQGKTTVLLTGEAGVLALFGVMDTVRETSHQAITELHALGVKSLMLSGDNPHTVAAIAQQVGIDEAYGNQLPEDKQQVIERLLGSGGKIGMVGDGVNDAPALARADIGFAMGAAGTDTAIETADVALMDDDLRKIPTFIRLSRATARILKQNIAIALSIKALFLVLTLAGLGTMWMAVFADMGASLIVIFNGLRLLRLK